MNEHFFGIFLLGTSLLQGNIAVSNSPNSPHRKLIDLTEDVSVLKQEMKNIQAVKNNFNEVLKKISDNELQQVAFYEQIKTSNSALTAELANLKNQYAEATKTLSAHAENQKEINQNLKLENEALKRLCEDLAKQPRIFEQKLQQLNAENSNLTEKLKTLESNTNVQKMQEIASLETAMMALQTELNDLKFNTPLSKLQTDNEIIRQKILSMDDIILQLNQLTENLSSVKNVTDGLTISRENIEKYLQDFYAEVTEKFNNIANEKEQKKSEEINFDEIRELNQTFVNFRKKYKKLDTLNDILVGFQNDLSQMEDSMFILNVSKENLEKDFKSLSAQTDKKIKDIKQVEADTENALKKQLEDLKQDVVDNCKNICQQTSNKINDQLQSITQQVQSKIDSLKARTFSKHVILSGESLSSIAKRYSTSPEQILITNNIQSARELRVGDTIIVPNNI